MPFIIRKSSPTKHDSKRQLYYLVENYRIGTRVKRKTLLVLGESRSLSECLSKTQQEEVALAKRLAETELIFDRFCKKGVMPALHNPRYPTIFRRKFLKLIEDDKKALEEIQERIATILELIDSIQVTKSIKINYH